MKSLVEEASSVAKAIEKAWTRAGKPATFSVKVYEEAQSGFLGFNSKPAKIGLFFEEHVSVKTHGADNRKKHHGSSDEQERPSRHHPRNHDQRSEETHEKKSHGHGNRDRHSDSNRSSDRRRSSGFDRKNQDRPNRHDNRPERKRHSSFEKKEHSISTASKPNVESGSQTVEHTAPAAAPVNTQPASQPTARRVLKVSSRRYSAPKNTNAEPAQPAADINKAE